MERGRGKTLLLAEGHARLGINKLINWCSLTSRQPDALLPPLPPSPDAFREIAINLHHSLHRNSTQQIANDLRHNQHPLHPLDVFDIPRFEIPFCILVLRLRGAISPNCSQHGISYPRRFSPGSSAYLLQNQPRHLDACATLSHQFFFRCLQDNCDHSDSDSSRFQG